MHLSNIENPVDREDHKCGAVQTNLPSPLQLGGFYNETQRVAAATTSLKVDHRVVSVGRPKIT